MTFLGWCAWVNGKQLKHITLYFPEFTASYTYHPALSHLHARKDYLDSKINITVAQNQYCVFVS